MWINNFHSNIMNEGHLLCPEDDASTLPAVLSAATFAKKLVCWWTTVWESTVATSTKLCLWPGMLVNKLSDIAMCSGGNPKGLWGKAVLWVFHWGLNTSCNERITAATHQDSRRKWEEKMFGASQRWCFQRVPRQPFLCSSQDVVYWFWSFMDRPSSLSFLNYV